MIVGVDVDGVVVDTSTRWLEWLQKETGRELIVRGKLNYDLTVYFEEELELKGMDGYEFWRESTLYDDMEPIPGAVETLTKLYKEGHEIVWVSQLKGNHFKSKVNFLKKHFPFWFGLIGTKEKQYARVDVLVDDRTSHLNKQPADTYKILFDSNYINEDYSVYGGYTVCKDWDEVYKEIRFLEKEG